VELATAAELAAAAHDGATTAEVAMVADHVPAAVVHGKGAVVAPSAGTASVVVRQRDTTREAKNESGERDEFEHHAP